MKVFLQHGMPGARARRVVVFGNGLIGSRIVRELECLGADCVLELKAAWRDDAELGRQFGRLRTHAETVTGAADTDLHFIWSAGSGSFSSTEELLRHEDGAFDLAVGTLARLDGFGSRAFHFISSAGGLFEGQVLVGAGDGPSPARPYGLMKLNQEERLAKTAAEAGLEHFVYRPSTVYGTRQFNFRAGLVSHLFWNALRNKPTTLEANFHALRDYVHATDVAKYVTGKALGGAHGDVRVHFLVSAKPSSIFEIAGKVERLLGRRLVLRYSDRTRNDRDITFRAEVMPRDWRPVDLDTGLRTVYRNTSFLYLGELRDPQLQHS